MSVSKSVVPVRQLKLIAAADMWLSDNHNWLHGEDGPKPVTFEDVVDLVAKAEREKFDGVFVPDFMGLNRATVGNNPPLPFEPLTMMAAMAAISKHVGVIGTASTLLSEPYNVARQLASVDHISDGRSGWNIVTSFTGAENFGKELPTPAERYEAAQEFVDVAMALWRSWDPRALVADRESKIFVDESRIHDIAHEGKFFSVEGALDIPPMPQGHPVLFQAGASPEGLAFAARNAEAVFVSYPSYQIGLEATTAFRQRVRDAGRDEDAVKIFPGLRVVLGETDRAARETMKREFVTDAMIRYVVDQIAGEFPGVDLRGLDRALPVPEGTFPSLAEIEKMPGRRSRILTWRRLAYDEFDTAGDFIDHIAAAYSHALFVGTAASVADEMEKWLTDGIADGFILSDSVDFDVLAADLFPLLRERGIFRSEYESTTLRGNLGLSPVAGLVTR